LTISKEQRDFAQARIQKAGLGDQVEIRLQTIATSATAMTGSLRSR